MKRIALLIPTLVAISVADFAMAQSNIDPTDKFAWGENVGWANWRDANGTNDGVFVGADYLEGLIWGENVGWINVGDGTPANMVNYANVNGTDFGVNILGDDDLDGYAWGENIGWINFGWGAISNDANRARFDFGAGRFRGYAWGENIGWINLDDATHFVSVVLGCSCANAVCVGGANNGMACANSAGCPGGKCKSLDCRNSLPPPLNTPVCAVDNACNCATCENGTCVLTCVRYGNVNCDPMNLVVLADILCVLNGFANFIVCTDADIEPCGGNGLINLGDILGVLNGFAGANPCACEPAGTPNLCGSIAP